MKKIEELEKKILKHKTLYYQGRPQIADFEYDELEESLRQIDPENKTLQLVGKVLLEEEKTKHDTKMLSLNKVYELGELERWREDQDVLITHKIDGVSCSLIYKEGKLSLGKTRGDGVYGENITEKIKWITSIPSKVNVTNNFEIRGELFCREDSYKALSKEMEEIGLKKPSSQRNIVAGLMGRKENLELVRYIDFLAFDYISKEKIKSEEEKFNHLKRLKLETPHFCITSNKKEIQREIEKTEEFLISGDYQIDGLVLTLNDCSRHKLLGETAHHPRYKMAFKYKGISKTTTIKDIDWQVSRTGILTPVAIVSPVELSGAIISKVTLHNYGIVKKHNLKIGDQIEMIRSGEVIPKFLKVLKSSNKKQKIPNKCPSCEKKIEIEEIRLYCRNEKCPGQLFENIMNYIKSIGISDLSKKRIESLIKNNKIKSIADLYKLKKETFLELENVQEKLATKFIESIDNAREIPLIKFITSFGIEGVAESKVEKILEEGFDTIEKIKKLNIEDIKKIDGFAEKSSEKFIESFKKKWNSMESVLDSGVSIKKETRNASVKKTFCITGTLTEKRSVVSNMIKNSGGKVSGTITQKTDYLVSNDKTSSSKKIKDAQKLNVKIISEKELKELLDG